MYFNLTNPMWKSVLFDIWNNNNRVNTEYTNTRDKFIKKQLLIMFRRVER